MKALLLYLLLILLVPALNSCRQSSGEYKTIEAEVLKDKIAGGWAGKMIGVTYGAPTEFRAQGRMYTDSLKWKPSDVKGSIWQDDIYVQLTFMMTMDKFGIEAPAKKYQEMFAKAGYPLWHANVQSRKNYYDSIFAPLSGMPEYNFHADDIDFQIESDYIGFMFPGMPKSANDLAGKIGHIMNYGDGVYGGIFVAALYSAAFFSSDIPAIIDYALRSIPSESEYYKIIKDVIRLHDQYPQAWDVAWIELVHKWDEEDICGAGDTFNIDAKLNGAFIVMGLLYGEGDPVKTMMITTRCGQDSDCNPSNAMALLGVIKGYSKLPVEYIDGVEGIKDSVFINTDYSFTKAVENTYKYALKNIENGGGMIKGDRITIRIQEPVAPAMEVSFPNVVYRETISVFNNEAWKYTGPWKTISRDGNQGEEARDISRWAEAKGASAEFTFEGTGVSLTGSWDKLGGRADIYIDGKLDRTIDTYFHYNNQQYGNTSIWHKFGLAPGKHRVTVEVKGEKRAGSEGARINLTEALIFTTAPKKSETFRFSFE